MVTSGNRVGRSARKARFPEREDSPGLRRGVKLYRLSAKTSLAKPCWRSPLAAPMFFATLVVIVHEENRGHSERRSTLFGERGGRGLFAGWRRSFPPASEREARMDDPTPRPKKGRETECPFGAPVPKQEPHLYSALGNRPRSAARWRRSNYLWLPCSVQSESMCRYALSDRDSAYRLNKLELH